jgi:hypothetical protein
MTEMRQLLRYEIPGLLVFIYTLVWILPFLEADILTCIFLKGHGLFVSCAVIALPLGWIIYQLYDAVYPRHYKKESIKLLKRLLIIHSTLCDIMEIKNATLYEELVNFFFVENVNGKKKDDLLRNYWDHHDARFVCGIFVPIISIFLIIFLFILLPQEYFDISIWSLHLESLLPFIFPGITLFLSYIFIYLPRKKILDEIDTRECLLIIFNIDKIIEIRKKVEELKKALK